jgi:hypothetical protein
MQEAVPIQTFEAPALLEARLSSQLNTHEAPSFDHTVKKGLKIASIMDS